MTTATELAIPLDTYDKHGLHYERLTCRQCRDDDCGDAVYATYPRHTFYVDDIRYDPHNRDGCHRLIIDVLEDHWCADDCETRLFSGVGIAQLSNPLTEEELDYWVRTGLIPFT
jgi:hypothetical protein